MTDINNIKKITKSITAPVLFSYITWVLSEAEKAQVKTLYFLARDGYVMHKIANIICEKNNIDIECKYLYCSRFSLRIPSYHIIGSEAYKLIFNGGYKITPNIVLSRVGLTDQQRNDVYDDINFNSAEENNLMSKSSYFIFSKKVSESKVFNNYLNQISQDAFIGINEYFRKQGLTQCSHIGLVDSGWTGSMQRTIRQLLQANMKQPKITGFYFGMYEKPIDIQDGEYKTFYFNHKTNPFKIAKFNNNLFECMCSAPHGMTVGYSIDGEPLFNANSNVNSFVNLQAETILECCWGLISVKERQTWIKRLQRLMYKPSTEEALSFSNFTFCDDVSESYIVSIAQPIKKQKIYAYTFVTRIYNKFFNKKIGIEQADNLFWIYGSLALSDIKCKWYFRLNIILWDVIRIWLKRR